MSSAPTEAMKQAVSNATTSKASFADYITANYGGDPRKIMAETFADLVAFAATYGAQLEYLPDLESKGYLPNLDGKPDQRQGYFCEPKRDKDALWPTVTINSFKAGGASAQWNPRDSLFRQYQAEKDGGTLTLEAITAEQRERYKEAADKAAQEAEARKAIRDQLDHEGRERAAVVAEQVWADALPCISHAYLERKRVKSYGLRVAVADVNVELWDSYAGKFVSKVAAKKDDLLIPMFYQGELVNLQRINQDGNKLFLTGGRKKGTFFTLPGEGQAILAEGYATAATVNAATGRPVAVAFDAGNLAEVAKQNPLMFTSVAADNDKPKDGQAKGAGEKAADATGLPFAMPPTVGQDWNDYAAEHGLQAVSALLAVQEKPRKSRFIIVDADHAADHCKAPSYIVDGILETDAHGMAYGASGTFKTFAMLRLAHSICTGQPFMGHKVRRPGKVVIVCGEGAPGISRRARALSIKHGAFGGNLSIILTGVDISDAASMDELQSELQKIQPMLVIFDTFAALNGGVDENSPSEVGQCLRLVRNCCRAVGASSLIVHHSGKDQTRGVRGASNFYADQDFVFHFKTTNAPTRQFEITSQAPMGKMKDGEPFTLCSRADVVRLDVFDEDGKECTSLVAEFDKDGVSLADDSDSSLNNWQRGLAVLRACYEGQKINLELGGHHGKTPTVTQADWYQAMKDAGIQNPSREKDTLIRKELVESLSGGEYRPT